MKYGNAPELHGIWDLKFEQYMHYMYLPVAIPDDRQHRFALPPELEFARELIEHAQYTEITEHDNFWSHVYVTARRGFATPGNPLNRPGWHSDGFGTPDVNYVWTDRYPTHFAVGDFGEISDDHVKSSEQFDVRAEERRNGIYLITYKDKTLMRLDPSVIHTAPPIPAPGGERSFFKVSFSNSRYNLKGNAHNHMLNYDWPMYDRAAVRNDPSRAQDDTVEEKK